MTNQEVILTVSDLLLQNPEWMSRYEGYARDIIERWQEYKKGESVFRAIKPFDAYTCISKAKGFPLAYDLRIKGQSLGTVKVSQKDDILFYPGENYNYFERQGITLPNMDKSESWNGAKMHQYRSILKQHEADLIVKSPEHEVENKLLYEFAKNKAEEKSLINIRPVTHCGLFFQMPTPLRASKHERIEYSSHSGGGIDILCRAIHKNDGVPRICVMEVKDENTNHEPQQIVIQQALAYATFIGELLQSDCGDYWWNLFGFMRKMPKKLHIDVVSVMPWNGIDNHVNETFQLSNTCQLHTYSLYYKEAELLRRERFQFEGTLTKALRK